MKKLLISLSCCLIMMSLFACSSKKTEIEDTNKNNTEESKSDINNLFIDIEDIESITTMRIDIQYILKTEKHINELMKLLKSTEYTVYDTDTNDKVEAEEPEKTGSSDNGISLTFAYKDGSKKFLEFSTNDEVEVAEYTELSYNPDVRKENKYTTNAEIWRDVLKLMLKGEMKDLNKK